MSEQTTEWPTAEPQAALEQRIERLEAALAALLDTSALEERIADRVSQQLQPSNNHITEELPPPPVEVPPLATPVTEARPSLASTVMASMASPKFRDVPWLLLDIYRELLAIVRMFVDLHYRVAWSTRVLTLVLLPAILLSGYWNPLAHLPLVGWIAEKVVDFALAFVIFKALSREARRYMEIRNPS